MPDEIDILGSLESDQQARVVESLEEVVDERLSRKAPNNVVQGTELYNYENAGMAEIDSAVYRRLDRALDSDDVEGSIEELQELGEEYAPGRIGRALRGIFNPSYNFLTDALNEAYEDAEITRSSP